MLRSGSVAVTVLAVVLTACSKPAPPPAPAPQRVANAALGIVIAELPEGFAVAENAGEKLVLKRTAADDPARVYVEVGPAQPGGVNLVQWVEAQPADFTAKPGGAFLGTKKLATPIGTAYTARGTYHGTAGDEGEIRILAVHPTEPRLLIVREVYPAGDDTTARAQQILDVFAEIEPLAATAAATPAG